MAAPAGAAFGPLWRELQTPLCEASLAALAAAGFARATPVQAAVIPLLAGNKDVAVEACTGSGKTLAFVLPLVEILLRAAAEAPLKKHEVGALIVSPTRELARQIIDVATPFLAALSGPGAMLFVGGSDPSADVSRFHETGAHVLVGTPGRLDDVMARSAAMSVRRLELLVLDEADRLLSMGFATQVGSILARLPKQRRTGLFSATQTEEVAELARAGLRNPVRVTVRDAASAGGGGGGIGEAPRGKTPSQLALYYGVCEADAKLPRLVTFLARHATEKVIVYFLTCACVDFFADALGGLPALRGVELTPLHGRMKQSARERAMAAFSAAPAGVLLATDVAARGLDIPGVDWVLQFDPPQDPDAFVHRCGRTARMGAAGASLLLLLPSEDTYVEFLRRRGAALQPAPPPDGDACDPDAFAAAGDGVLAAVRQRAEREREIMEKGSRAFVSFVRGYKEHQCRFIFRFKELSLGRLAASFGLLRLPRMPETKRAGDTAPHFVPSDVVPDDVPYKDRAREKLRLQRRAEDAAEKAAAAAAAPARPRADEARRAPPPEPAAKLPALKRRLEQTRADDDDMEAEWKLLKKLKKGAISEHEYNMAVGLSDDDSDGGDSDGDAGAKRPQQQPAQQHWKHKQQHGGKRGGGGGGGGGGGHGGEREPERRSKPRHHKQGGRGGGRGGSRGRGRR